MEMMILILLMDKKINLNIKKSKNMIKKKNKSMIKKKNRSMNKKKNKSMNKKKNKRFDELNELFFYLYINYIIKKYLITYKNKSYFNI